LFRFSGNLQKSIFAVLELFIFFSLQENMSIEATDEATLQKMTRSTRSLSGGKTKLLSKITSTVKFVMRANPHQPDSNDPQKRKQFHRQGCKLLSPI